MRAAHDLTCCHIPGALFAAFYPETRAGEVAWAELAAATGGTGKVLAPHVPDTLAQLRAAGYVVRVTRRQAKTPSADDLARALEA